MAVTMGMTVNFRCRPISGHFEIFTLYSPIVPLFPHDCNCLMSMLFFLAALISECTIEIVM